MTLDLSGLRRGMEAAKEMQESMRTSRGTFAIFDYFKMEDGDGQFYRFLEPYEEWTYLNFHTFLDPPPKPEGEKHWPKAFSVICRNDPQLTDQFPDGCPICDEPGAFHQDPKRAKSKLRSLTLAIPRETAYKMGDDIIFPRYDKDAREKGEKLLKNSKQYGEAATVGGRGLPGPFEFEAFKDRDGNGGTRPKWTIVQQPIYECLDQLRGQVMELRNGEGSPDLRDWDVWISRKGKGRDTDWTLSVSRTPRDFRGDIILLSETTEREVEVKDEDGKVVKRKVNVQGVRVDKDGNRHPMSTAADAKRAKGLEPTAEDEERNALFPAWTIDEVIEDLAMGDRWEKFVFPLVGKGVTSDPEEEALKVMQGDVRSYPDENENGNGDGKGEQEATKAAASSGLSDDDIPF